MLLGYNVVENQTPKLEIMKNIIDAINPLIKMFLKLNFFKNAIETRDKIIVAVYVQIAPVYNITNLSKKDE